MSQERPLSRLAAYVAAARARGRPTRLVLRNTERFGLVHLYFQQGHLVAVEGYRGQGLPSLAAVATWANGTIRQDDLEDQALAAEPDPALDRDLDVLVNALATRAGATGPLTPTGPSTPSTPSLTTPGEGAFTPLRSLPALGTQTTTAGPAQSTPMDQAPQPSNDPSLLPLTPPQWQVLTLAMHQIVERASAEVGAPVAAGFLVQALGRLAARAPFLAGLEVDDAAWLRAQPSLIGRVPAYEVATDIAELIMAYEARCSAMVGPEAARRIILDGTAPLQHALAQVGLDVAAH